MVKGSQTAGVTPMGISGRYERERERLFGMTDEERAFRNQWLKDQHLAADEPKNVPEMYRATHNPIRRAYRWPLNQVQKILEPSLGAERAFTIRYWSGKFFIVVASLYAATYYAKYNSNDWTRAGGWLAFKSRKSVLDGDEGYPKLSDRSQPSDYASRGFKDFKLNL